MADWINNPATWIIAAAAVAGTLFAAGKWVGAVNSDRGTFKAFMEEVRKDIKKILQRLPSRTVYSGSPLRLTDFGERISECLGSEFIVDSLVSAVRVRIKDKSSYDVQQLCFDYVKNEWKMSDETESMIRECAYENGTDREQVLDVIAVELRDRLLSSEDFSMAKPRDTYKYQFKVGNKVVHCGITNDLDRRETEHQEKWPTGHIKQVGNKTTEEAARAWEKDKGY